MGVKKHHNMSLESVCHAPKDYLHLDFFSAQIRKNDFIKHIKQSNLMTEFKQTDPSSDLHWQKVICLAFRSLPPSLYLLCFIFFWNSMPSKNISGHNWYIWLRLIKIDFLRIFDINNDGFIDKKEFRWMTTSNVISPEVIQTVFQVVYKSFFVIAVWL